MKKSLAIVLAMTLVSSCLTACGGSNKSADAAKTEAVSEKTNQAQESVEVPAIKGPGNVSLKRLSYNVAFDPNEDICASVIEKSTGYQVEYFTLPAENADEKLIMEVAGGADYDVLQVSPAQYQTLLSQGALMPLNDLLETYGQDILAGVSEETWRAASDDEGTIYAIPYKYPYAQEVQSFLVCRWDLAAAAGITEVPTTIDEFHDMLLKLKEHYGDEYIILSGPYRAASEGNGTWIFPKVIASAFGIYNDWMVDENGSVYYMTEHPNFQKMIEFMSTLQAEGLLDPDWAANTSATVNEKFAGGKTIVSCTQRDGLGKVLPGMIENGLTYDDFRYIAPLEGEDGTCVYMKTEAVNFFSVILKGSKNAADVVNWINLKQNDQLYLNIGEEGVHFNYDEEGAIAPINPIFSEERGNSYWYIDSTNEAEFATEWPSRVRKSDAQWAGFSAVTLETNENRPEIFTPNPFAFKPATEKYAKYNVALFSNMNDFILQVLAGTKTMDDLETFNKEWTAAGGADVKTELQEWYDGFYK